MPDNIEAKDCFTDRREYFRVTDVLPITVKKIENMVGKKSRVLSGYFSGLGSVNLAEDAERRTSKSQTGENAV